MVQNCLNEHGNQLVFVKSSLVTLIPKIKFTVIVKTQPNCLVSENTFNSLSNLSKWANATFILKSQKNQTKEIKEEIKLLESLLEERLRAIYKIQENRESSLKDVKEKRNEIIDKLSHKYDHLSNVYCEYDRLTPFNYKSNPHFPEEHPKNQYRGF